MDELYKASPGVRRTSRVCSRCSVLWLPGNPIAQIICGPEESVTVSAPYPQLVNYTQYYIFPLSSPSGPLTYGQGAQNILEQPGCITPRGNPCWLEDLQRYDCREVWGPPADSPSWVDPVSLANVGIAAVNQTWETAISMFADEPDADIRNALIINHVTSWFVNQVKTNGPWDLRNNPQYGPQAENLGNWFFGVVGTSAFGETVARFGAGVYQTLFQGGPQSIPF